MRQTKPLTLPMEAEALAHLGGDHIAYLRKMSPDDFVRLFPSAPEIELGGPLFAIFRADGTPIAVADTAAAAVANAAEHDLETVSVH